MSIRDILDVHKNEQQQLKSEMLKLMSENFESQLEDIVEQILNEGKNGFAIIIEREHGNQNDPYNLWRWVDNTSYHIQRIDRELDFQKYNIMIATKDELKEIKRLLVESELDVEHVFVHNLSGHWPCFGGAEFVDPDGDDNVKILDFPDKIFNAFWKDGVRLFSCENGEINLERKLRINFSKESTQRFWNASVREFNCGAIDTKDNLPLPSSSDMIGFEVNYILNNHVDPGNRPKYSLLFCIF